MRATTAGISKVSRAMRAARMFELSPLVTAASAPVLGGPRPLEDVSVKASADDVLAPPQAAGRRRNAVRVVLVDHRDGVAVADPA